MFMKICDFLGSEHCRALMETLVGNEGRALLNFKIVISN